ncbi:MAG: preprotein translocase subunit SecG [Holophagae bacterium]
MTVLLVILYILVCLFLILVVLLQQGKGADLAGAFGGGGSQTSFGPRSGTNIMHRMTTVAFVLFVVLCLALAILSGKQRGSVMEDVVVPVDASDQAQPAVAPIPDAAVPDTEGDVAPEGAEAPADAAAEEPAGDEPATSDGG